MHDDPGGPVVQTEIERVRVRSGADRHAEDVDGELTPAVEVGGLDDQIAQGVRSGTSKGSGRRLWMRPRIRQRQRGLVPAPSGSNPMNRPRDNDR